MVSLRTPGGLALNVSPVMRVDGVERNADTADEVITTGSGVVLRWGELELTLTTQVTIDGGHDVSVAMRAGDQAVVVESLGVAIDSTQATRLLAEGYHSWDWSGLCDLAQPGHSWWGTLLGTPGGPRNAVRLRNIPTVGALAFLWQGDGKLEARTTGTPLQAGDRTGGPTSLNVTVPAGERFAGETITIAPYQSATITGAGLPQLAADDHQPLPRQVGWMSWNIFEKRVLASNIVDAVDMVPDGGLLFLDDGWMPAWGDWYAHPNFGATLEELSADLAAKNRQLGVWFNPFHVALHSEVARTHPEWLLRDRSGDVMIDPRPGHPNHVLDASIPAVREHLAALGTRLGAAGVAAIKIDFVYAGTLPGIRATGWTDVSAARAGLEALITGYRTAAGPQGRVYGCGAPGPLLVGLADANRSGADGIIGLAGFAGNTSHDIRSLQAQERNLAARAVLWGSTLPTDVDALTLGQFHQHPAIDDAGVEQWMRIADRSGGPLFGSDTLDQIDASRQHQFLRLAAQLEGRPAIPERPLDPLAGNAIAPQPPDFFHPGGRVQSAWTGDPGLSL